MVVVKVIVMVIAMVMVMVLTGVVPRRTSLPVFQPSSLPAFQSSSLPVFQPSNLRLMVMVMVMVKAHRVLRTRGAGPWQYHAAHPTSTSHHAEGADRQDRPARPSSDHPPPQGKGPDEGLA